MMSTDLNDFFLKLKIETCISYSHRVRFTLKYIFDNIIFNHRT